MAEKVVTDEQIAKWMEWLRAEARDPGQWTDKEPPVSKLDLIARVRQEVARRKTDQRRHKESADRLARLLDPHMPAHGWEEVPIDPETPWPQYPRTSYRCRYCSQVSEAPVRPTYDPCDKAPNPHDSEGLWAIIEQLKDRLMAAEGVLQYEDLERREYGEARERKEKGAAKEDEAS